jgi:hypothetical protein
MPLCPSAHNEIWLQPTVDSETKMDIGDIIDVDIGRMSSIEGG